MPLIIEFYNLFLQSQLHGISSYEWAVGTTSGGEDIQPLTSDGVVPGSDPDIPGKSTIILDILYSLGMTYTKYYIDEQNNKYRGLRGNS